MDTVITNAENIAYHYKGTALANVLGELDSFAYYTATINADNSIPTVTTNADFAGVNNAAITAGIFSPPFSYLVLLFLCFVIIVFT